MKRFYFLLLFMFCSVIVASATTHGSTIKGVVLSKDDRSPIAYATVAIEGTSHGAVTDVNGAFEFKVPAGDHIFAVSFVGYKEYSEALTLSRGERISLTIEMTPTSLAIDEVNVKGESNSVKVNKTAFNVQAVAIDDIKNTTANLTDALSKVNGVRIRETGGVGSEAKISVNGFSGSHVKIFVDGILQGNNSAFSLNNIPANFAERIEVYSGAAPIEFGSDALGAVINIVTKKHNQEGWNLDASYSYGSFNTHRSNVAFTQQFDNGLQYKINAYQNYSDNNYEIDNTVTIFTGTNTEYTPNDIYTVERFNDTYHNEAIIAEVGVRGKKWADVALFSMNYAQFYKEVQTGTRQSVVYGGRHREGHSLIPTFQYNKRDFLTEGLNVKANANYNYGETLVVDTTSYKYNWFGDKQLTSSRTYTYRETKDNSWNVNANALYRINEAHTLALNYSINSTTRQTRSAESGTIFGDYAEPQYTTKGVSAFSYMYKLSDIFNAQAFSKYYMQSNDGVTYDDEGVRYERNAKNGYLGYGAATTGFFLNGFQAKLSYEKAYRLPTTTELFGDNDLELGNVTLNPENSDNYNANILYNKGFGKHSLYLGGGLVYSDTKDFIRRVVSSDGESASSVNHGNVRSKGWNVSFSYDYGQFLSVGGNINALNARDNEKIDITTGYSSLTYGQRIPNEPYLYANADGRINFYNVITKNEHFYISYSLLYQHEFPLDWEDFGDKDTKKYVPTQWSHDLALHYALNEGKYSFTLQCKNIMDAKLYDNYSLQKAGRAFYVKVGIRIGSIKKLTIQ